MSNPKPSYVDMHAQMDALKGLMVNQFGAEARADGHRPVREFMLMVQFHLPGGLSYWRHYVFGGEGMARLAVTVFVVRCRMGEMSTVRRAEYWEPGAPVSKLVYSRNMLEGDDDGR